VDLTGAKRPPPLAFALFSVALPAAQVPGLVHRRTEDGLELRSATYLSNTSTGDLFTVLRDRAHIAFLIDELALSLGMREKVRTALELVAFASATPRSKQ
jgi:hypothetical protein